MRDAWFAFFAFLILACTYPHLTHVCTCRAISGQAQARRRPPTSRRAREVRDGLLARLLPTGRGANLGRRQLASAQRAEVDALLDELAALQEPFVEDDLSGGPGVVRA